MGVAIEVTGAVAGLAIAATSRTKRGIGRSRISGASSRIMASSTGVMNLIVHRIHRSSQGCTLNQSVRVTSITLDMIVNSSGMVSLDVVYKIGAMTGITVTAAYRAERSLARRCRLRGAVGVMTGQAGIMHLGAWGCVNRNAGG